MSAETITMFARGVLLVAAVSSACTPRGGERPCGVESATLTASARAELEKALQLSLPATVGPAWYRIERGGDTGVRARLRMPCGDAAALQQQLGLADADLADRVDLDRMKDQLDCSWWQFAALSSPRAGTAERTAGNARLFTTFATGDDGSGSCDVYLFHVDM